LTAQFEHTLVVTERGAEVLTLPSTIGTAAAPAAL
jgi:methionyl aminopeptidase